MAFILREIRKLPWTERLVVVERALKNIRQDKQRGLEQAVEALQQDYATDAELTVFTRLDADQFYEAR